MKNTLRLSIACAVLAGNTLLPNVALACGACFGAADSPETHGMNFAILSMLGITGGVLTMFTSFFLYLRKRAKLYLAAEAQHSSNDNGGVH